SRGGLPHWRHLEDEISELAEMASQLNARLARIQHPMPPVPEISPEGYAQHKLSRLLELRAVIDAMRCEHETQDPLLAWVTAHEDTAAS
ncbi:MAG: hypothetical protein ACJ8MR_16470, partial [Povalibacter sp.]